MYEHILSPVTIRRVTFKNRVMAAPASSSHICVDGRPTQTALLVYHERARGGFGCVTLGENYVDFDRSGLHRHGINIIPPVSFEHAQALYALAEAIKSHGAVASVELNHVGALTKPAFCNGKNPIGPSAFIREDGVEVEQMDEAMMEEVAESFAKAALYAKEIGFQMILIHGGHGWLLSQFISPLFNKRTDEYGGSIENRARFPLMVVDKIREKVGEDFLIEYRLSGTENVEGGITLEDTCRFAELLDGKVDIIHVSAGTYTNHVLTKQFSSMFDPHGLNLPAAAEVKKHVQKSLVSCVGGINDPDQAEEAVAAGMCDFIVLGRQQIADPNWVRKVELGRADEIAPCLRCSCFNPARPSSCGYTHAHYRTCTVNPVAGREEQVRLMASPAVSRKVLVIGGGPAGMYAAITAAQRGHKVTLVEKKETLGGTLWFTDYDIHKKDLRKFRISLETRLKRSGAEVITGKEADIGFIKDFGADYVIVAVGAKPSAPPVKGIEKARPMLDAYADLDSIGKDVVIIGGGLIGCESGALLAELGRNVTLMEYLPDLGGGANLSHYEAIMDRIKDCLAWHTSVSCTEITDDGVKYVTDQGRGEKKFIHADTILYATGMRSETGLMEELRKEGIFFIPAGDCERPQNVEKAVFQGFMSAMDIVL